MASSPEAPARTSEPAAGSLKRAISRNMLLVLVVGDVLGAGIYALVGEVGGRVGGAIWSASIERRERDEPFERRLASAKAAIGRS